VVVFAVEVYHVGDGFFLAYHSFVGGVGRLGFHVDQLICGGFVV